MAAEFRNLLALNLAPETGGFTHGIHIRLARVAAMTTGAGQPFLSVDVLRELGLSYLQRRIQGSVAIQACTRRLCAGPAGTNTYHRQQQD